MSLLCLLKPLHQHCAPIQIHLSSHSGCSVYLAPKDTWGYCKGSCKMPGWYPEESNPDKRLQIHLTKETAGGHGNIWCRERETERGAQIVEDGEDDGENLVGGFDQDGEKAATVGINLLWGQCYIGRKWPGSRYFKQSMLTPPGPVTWRKWWLLCWFYPGINLKHQSLLKMKKWIFEINGHWESGVKGKQREGKEHPKRLSLFWKKLLLH